MPVPIHTRGLFPFSSAARGMSIPTGNWPIQYIWGDYLHLLESLYVDPYSYGGGVIFTFSSAAILTMWRLFSFLSLLYVSPYTYGAFISISSATHGMSILTGHLFNLPYGGAYFHFLAPRYVAPYTYGDIIFFIHFHGAPIPYTRGALIFILDFYCITFAELILTPYRLCTLSYIPTGRLFSFPIASVRRSHMGNLFNSYLWGDYIHFLASRNVEPIWGAYSILTYGALIFIC